MRKKSWLQFHLWTVALLAVLTVANVFSALRPFSSSSALDRSSTGGMRLSQLNSKADRSPASTTELEVGQTLKLAQLPCESVLRLKVTEHVKNLRLQFDSCVDDVIGIRNTTNGFEGTVFGNSPAVAPEMAEIAGNFIDAEAKNLPAKKTVARAVASTKTMASKVSTDYISLAPGKNEIRVQRANRQQILHIERR